MSDRIVEAIHGLPYCCDEAADCRKLARVLARYYHASASRLSAALLGKPWCCDSLADCRRIVAFCDRL